MKTAHIDRALHACSCWVYFLAQEHQEYIEEYRTWSLEQRSTKKDVEGLPKRAHHRTSCDCILTISLPMRPYNTEGWAYQTKSRTFGKGNIAASAYRAVYKGS
eukprot:388985-Pelagomonas_calceolata.AAC.10